MNHYDVIIIGTGAGGGTLAYKLAPSGKKILLLERGDYVPREKDNWSTRAVNLEAKYNTKEAWRDSEGKELHPHTNYFVGGNTKFYGAALFRLRKEDFGEIRHHGGISPAWPIGYDDLASYFLGFAWIIGDEIQSWDDTLVRFAQLGIVPVPTLYRGAFTPGLFESIAATLDVSKQEGFVVRVATAFPESNMSTHLAKYVRDAHVQDETHWMKAQLIPNRLAKS